MPRDRFSELYRRTPHLWDQILADVDLSALKNLRLASRTLNLACIHHRRFAHYVQRQTLDLSRGDTIASLTALAAHPVLGRAVKHVTVQATVYNIYTDQDNGHLYDDRYNGYHSREIKSNEYWEEARLQRRKQLDEQLSFAEPDAMGALTAVFSALGCLGSLSMEIRAIHSLPLPKAHVSPPKIPGRLVWEATGRAYRVVMRSIWQSNLNVTRLYLYQDTPKSCLSIQDVTSYLDDETDEGRTFLLPSVKVLAITIGEGHQRDLDLDKERHAVANLLKSMPYLESLDLHFYRHAKTQEFMASPLAFQTLAAPESRVHLPYLTRCRLRGIRFGRPMPSPDWFATFLSRHPTIRDLELEEICLFPAGDAWSTLLPQVVRLLPVLTRLRLSSLWTTSGLLNLDPAWTKLDLGNEKRTSSYPCVDGTMVHAVELNGDQLRPEMSFKPAPMGRPLGSPWFMQFRARRERLYGTTRF